MSFSAWFGTEEFELARGFDLFGQHRQPKTFAQAEHRQDNRSGLTVVMDQLEFLPLEGRAQAVIDGITLEVAVLDQCRLLQKRGSRPRTIPSSSRPPSSG
ncbi:hypothetical protein [Allomesorhizobium camelthorni]|uniref:Uncharacterized protein n=1 Tax=Allomesorhizobium camelthorni TaxID=475069 RepID=A0A6G4WPC3_9HYPH|nr:hypothetical protein [Mesorhizobium camelthorni]NGO55917.1 hypothetical protein [Mesorhizobium camelthorni]